MDASTLILDSLNRLGEDFKTLKAEREKLSSDQTELKKDFDARLSSMERNVDQMNKLLAQQHKLSIPGLPTSGVGKVSWGRIAQICAQPGLLKEKEYGLEADVYKLMCSRIDSFDAQTRASINAATGEQGGFLIPTEMMSEIVPQLREASIARQLGVTEINGLVGEVWWAKSKGGITAEHVNTEDEVSGSETAATFDRIAMKPHPIAAFVPLTFEMRQQSAIALDDWVRSEVATQIGLLEDQTIFTGSGIGPIPRGISNHPSVQQLSFSGIDYTGSNQTVYRQLLNAIKLTRKKYGHTLGNLGWATCPNVLYHLAKGMDSQGRPLFFSLTEGSMQTANVPARVLRYPILDSEQLAVSATTEIMIFGPWADVILGHWGTLVFAISDQTETNFRKLRTTVRGVWQYDVGVFHADAFVKCHTIDTNTEPT